MKFSYIQHVDFETPGAIINWCYKNQIQIDGYFLYKEDRFPQIEDYDVFVIMGGPMGVYDEARFPWLKKEKQFIEKLIHNNKRILGICLGAQLIANVLGAKVYKNTYKEIGWFTVNSTSYTKNHYQFFPNKFVAFHWHGDTFELPMGAHHLFYNQATINQGFVYKENLWAFQFHLESTHNTIHNLYHFAKDDLNTDNKKYIQESDHKKNQFYINQSNEILFKFLDYLSKNK
ncbi:MAG: type 1 glutamine amidotransferase [Leptonema sp. (in: bacteria)]